jgi:glycosyltransferase involved in cell wall biosynthesis
MKIAEVSVIIPCYKCSQSIGRAVASVAAQTLPPREVILVDDCSEDETLNVLYGLQAAYPTDWIQVIAGVENCGPGTARNVGWEAARQPYVAFLDADDSWHPQKIEVQYGWMRAHPEVALSGHACRVIKKGKSLKKSDEIVHPSSFESVSKYTLLLSNRFPTPSVMLRRSLPHRFCPGKRQSEDFLLWCQIFLDGHPCYRSAAPLCELHKAHYGSGGLSGDLWAMEKGEWDTYMRLHRSGHIGGMLAASLCVISFIKYLRRLVLDVLRRMSA